ncbi:hypothetical protein [Sphingomonas sp. GB1N7]|uniref:hypothetical protein n=1 Tax=Parasphingomonas caseinilytica TaxID=3096158 RepID=UPI002FCC26A8
MRALLLPLLILPTALAATPHSGVIHTRSMPELSDIALFVMAAAGVWIVRRAMRRRFEKARKD